MTEKTEQATHILKIRKQFNAPIERLFKAFTEKETLKQWWSRDANMTCSLIEVDFNVGGKYRFGLKDAKTGNEFIVGGVYTEIIPNEKISMTWAWEHEPNEEETLVTFVFSGTETESELLLIHSKFPTEERKELHNEGWSCIINTLHRLFEPEDE